MIDVHVISSADERARPWWDECLASLDHPALRVFHVESIPDQLGLCRARGYAQGSAPYVTAVDSDDLLEPVVIQHVLDTFERHPESTAVYANERQFGEGMDDRLAFDEPATRPRLQYSQMHGLVVLRREVTDAVMHMLPDVPRLARRWAYLQALHSGPVVGLARVGYHWRLRPDSARSQPGPWHSPHGRWMRERIESLYG